MNDEKKIFIFLVIMVGIICSCFFYAKGFEVGYKQCARELIIKSKY